MAGALPLSYRRKVGVLMTPRSYPLAFLCWSDSEGLLSASAHHFTLSSPAPDLIARTQRLLAEMDHGRGIEPRT